MRADYYIKDKFWDKKEFGAINYENGFFVGELIHSNYIVVYVEEYNDEFFKEANDFKPGKYGCIYKAVRENGNERHLDLVTILLGDFRQDFYTGGEKIDCIILDGKIYDVYCGHKKYEGSYYFDPKYDVHDWYDEPLSVENWRVLHDFSTGTFIGNTIIKGTRGHGIFYYEDGRIRYKGEWANGKKHGYGTEYLFITQEDKYEEHVYRGEWIDDEKDGFGRFFINNFLVYEGYWHENTFNGYGELYYTDEDYRGLKFKGIFYSGYPWEGIVGCTMMCNS